MIDFNLQKGDAVIYSDEELILQQIDILFNTYKKSILGDEEFGTEYDRYLYKLNISNESLEYRVLNDLNSLELFGYIPEVKVYLLQGTEQDIALINITFTKETNKFEKTYKIS